MTKRFQVYIDSNNLKSLWDDNGDGEPLLFLDREDAIQGVDEVCDLLNEQHEQIERLKRNFKALDEVKCELVEENEQLKSKNRGLQSELGIFKEDVTHSNQIINKLNDENEQLKEEIKDLNDVLARYEEKELYE